METQRLSVKLMAAPSFAASEKELILFFHRVIQEHKVPETFVDVTDYSHVPGGPGVMLICHEAHYGMDGSGGQGPLGLKCATRRGMKGDISARIASAFQKTLAMALSMSTHETLVGRADFMTNRLLFSIEDRLVAPNTDETLTFLSGPLGELVSKVWGEKPTLARKGSSKECFQVEVSLRESPPLSDLVQRLV